MSCCSSNWIVSRDLLSRIWKFNLLEMSLDISMSHLQFVRCIRKVVRQASLRITIISHYQFARWMSRIMREAAIQMTIFRSDGPRKTSGPPNNWSFSFPRGQISFYSVLKRCSREECRPRSRRSARETSDIRLDPQLNVTGPARWNFWA